MHPERSGKLLASDIISVKYELIKFTFNIDSPITIILTHVRNM
jgi:hypothetical protein